MTSATFKIGGNVAKLWACRDPEVLYHGPRGSGKSRPMCELLVRDAMKTQGTRIGIGRKSRASMSQTTLVTLEGVLAQLHPQALTGCTREHVSSYWIGESELIIAGCDHESRNRGGEVAKWWFDEAHEITVDDWESTSGAIRWPIASWRAMYATCNPDSDKHHLWKRVLDKQLTAIRSRHEDNPSVTAEYLTRLAKLTGVRRKRFYEGIWCQAEGQVFDNFEEDTHVIDCPLKADESYDYEALGISWYFASMDWGVREAGCLGVWGVDLAGRLYQVAEVYFSGKRLPWWCDRLVEINRLFKIQAIVCDHDIDMIAAYNEALGYEPEAPDAIAFQAHKKRGSLSNDDRAGLDCVYNALQPADDGKPRLFFLRDNQPFGIDQALRDAGKPCSTTEEVSGYVWAKTADGRLMRDVTDQNCADHGWDQTRYACVYAKGRAYIPTPEVQPDEPGTYGELYGHNRLWEILKLEDQGHDVRRLVAAHKQARRK